jgi:ABC-type ATPase involved in cell division
VKIELESPVKRSGRVQQVEGMMDVPQADVQRTVINVPQAMVDVAMGKPAQPWQIGLIVGPSGSGKTTAANALFTHNPMPEWDADRALVDGFPRALTGKDVTGWLTSVGLGSPPAWLRPYRTLSTGEQFRADVARALAYATPESPTVIDEFTSTVDRQVAQVASHAVAKAVRRTDLQLVAVACHFDIIDWLQPDWVYRPDTVDFEWRRLQRRPSIDVEITTLPKSAWAPFARYHYLSHVLHGAAKCFGLWIGDECVAFNAFIPFPHPSRKNIRMGHRLVVLPDYQGLGLGLFFDDWLGQWLWERGYRYHKTISHPALIHAYSKSPRWEALPTQNKPTRGGAKRLQKTSQNTRKLATRGFRYVAPAGSSTQKANFANLSVPG